MPVPVSSLSVAVQGIADFLNTQFDEDVRVAVNTPQAANEAIKGNNQTVHCLNIFPYRVAPSGFHPDIGSDETQFIRINALLTPFPDEGETEVEDTDLRILGHAIRVLHSNPVLPVNATPLPGPAITDPPGRKDYRLQAILLAPPMEELNHIWTTQGGELAYRLSAAYEFALIPIEPIEERVPADPPRSAVLGLEPQVADGPSGLGAGGQVIPLSGPIPGSDPGTTWLPLQLLVVSDALTNTATVAPADTEIGFAISGQAGETAFVEIAWTLADDSEQIQVGQLVPVATPVIDAEDARTTLTLSVPGTAVSGVVLTRAAAGGAVVPESPFANVLTLTVS